MVSRRPSGAKATRPQPGRSEPPKPRHREPRYRPDVSAGKLKDGRALILIVLLASLLLNAVPLGWGLPVQHRSWAFDELTPEEVMARGTGQRSASGWAERYPPFHFYLLFLLYSAVRSLGSSLGPAELHTAYTVAGRWLSVLMATGTVYLVYRAARLLAGRAAACFAALLLASTAPFVYYAKVINLDGPYLFWVSASVFFLLRVLTKQRLGDYVALAVTTTLAVVTKDQAYALYVLAPLPIVAALARWRQARGRPAGLWRALLDRRIVISFAICLLVAAAVYNVVFDPYGLVHHLRTARELGPQFTLYENTPAGHLQMAWQSVRHLGFALGWPSFALCVAGVVLALVRGRRDPRDLALLLMCLSYYVFFISIARYNYVRFFLPVCVVLALFGGRALAALVAWPRPPRWLRALAAAGVLAYGLAYAASVDLRMHHDSRYAVERWYDNLPPGWHASVLFQESPNLPRVESVVDLPVFARRPHAFLRGMDANYLLVNEVDVAGGRWNEILVALHDGRFNYRRRWRFEVQPPFDLLDTRGMVTNLDKVNPPFVVFERVSDWLEPPDEIQSRVDALLARRAADEIERLAERMAQGGLPELEPLLGDRIRALGLTSDRWVVAGRPALLLLHNPTPVAWQPRFQLRGVAAAAATPVTLDDGRRPLGLTVGQGALAVDLPPLDPGRSRLFRLSGSAVAPPLDGGRRLVARLDLGNRTVLADGAATFYGLTRTGWTRPAREPVPLVVANRSGQRARAVLRVDSRATVDKPATLRIDGLRGRTAHSLGPAGPHDVDLGPIDAYGSVVVHLSTDGDRASRRLRPLDLRLEPVPER